jgi:hypothetical protein
MYKWIDVNESLPDPCEEVLIFTKEGRYQIAIFQKGMSLKEREQMKNGEIPTTYVNQTDYIVESKEFVTTTIPRYEVFYFIDERDGSPDRYYWEATNNIDYVNREVSHWCRLPTEPGTKFHLIDLETEQVFSLNLHRNK